MKLEFEWDEKKNAINIRKHNISFEEAATVFSDPNRYEIYDGIHSLAEKRWIVIGLAGFNMLKVSFTERKSRIRVISARKADKDDIKEYLNGNSTKGN